MIIAASLLVVCSLGPSVAVEVSANDPDRDDALRGWLAARLLEEGYDIAPSTAAASATVRVSRAGRGLAVDVVGDGLRSFAVEDGPPAVFRLEVLHRALQGVEATAPTDVPAPAAPGMVVQFLGPRDPALLAEIANAARTSGTALHADALPGDTRVCVAKRADLAEIGVGPASEGCAPADTVASVSTGPQRKAAAMELLARVAPSVVPEVEPPPDPASGDGSLLRIVDDGERSAGASAYADPPAAVLVEEDDGELPPMHGPPRAEVRIGAEGGIVVRGAVDAAMRGRVRLGRINGFGGRFELAAVPSREQSLRIVDTYLMAGPDWQIGVGQRTRLMVAATAGADIHTYRTDLTSSAEVNWAVALPAGVSLALRGGARVHLMLDPGLSGVKTNHVRRNLDSWERTAWRVGVAVGFSHAWRIE